MKLSKTQKKHSKSVKHWAGGRENGLPPKLRASFLAWNTKWPKTLINITNKLKTSSSLLVYTRTETFSISIVIYKRSLLFSLQKRHVFPLFSYFRASEGNRDGQVFIFNISCWKSFKNPPFWNYTVSCLEKKVLFFYLVRCASSK